LKIFEELLTEGQCSKVTSNFLTFHYEHKSFEAFPCHDS